MTPCFFGKGKRASCFLLCIWLCSQAVFSQNYANHAVPNSLRRPERGEVPRYPADLVIGDLSRGEASESAYSFARSILLALVNKRRDSSAFGNSSNLYESVFTEVENLGPRTFRLGGGKAEPDGCTSFLIRFISQEESITGELFIRRAEASELEASETGRWLLDDIILETKRTLSEIRDSYRYNFSPYERFY